MSSNSMASTSSQSFRSRLSRQAPRRVLVSAWALCCVGFLVLGALEIKGVVWFVLFALTFAVDGLLFTATRRVTDRPTSTLDERQQAVRNRAYRAAYLFVFYALTLVVGGALLLFYAGTEIAPGWFSHPAGHYVVLTGLGIATLQLVSLLPTAILAWSEQDEPGELD